MNNFDVKMAVGKQGETAVKEYLEGRNHQVEDVSDNPSYWNKDIDFLLINTTQNQSCSLEVKSDKRIHETGNLCIEIGNDRMTGWREGWYYYCEADYICFYDYTDGRGYILDWQAAKPEVKNAAQFKRFMSSDGCYSDVYLLPIGMAKKKGWITHQFQLEEVA